MRPRASELVELTTLVVLRELARRATYLAAEIDRLDDLLLPLITLRAPALLATPGVGPDSAAILLMPPATTPNGSAARRLGASVRRRSDPGLVGQGRPPAAEPGR